MRATVPVLLAVLLGGRAGPAAADEPDRQERSRQLYVEGRAEFEAGHVEAAIDAFERGYALDPRPEFLLNLAQSYRALGRRAEAIRYLERFISEAPDHELRPAAEKTLGELRRAEAQSGSGVTARPPRPPRPRPVPIVPAPRETAPVERDERRLSPWLWVAASAVVVIGGGVALYFAMRSDDPNVIDTIELP